MRKTGILAVLVLIAGVAVLSGCVQQQTQVKTCVQQGGYLCNENETCFGKLLDASDTKNCCSVVCTLPTEGTTPTASPIPKVETPTPTQVTQTLIPSQEKSLEEMNLNANDFTSDFQLNDATSGYQKNALEYTGGNQSQANEFLSHGWQENYAAEYIKRSKTQEIFGTKLILEDYLVSLSRYDKTKSYQGYFKDNMNEYKLFLSKNASILSQTFGDDSVFAKVTESNEFTGITTVSYVIYFTKDNVWVNFFAVGQPRQISDEKVINYAKIVEARIA
jgi:hypothetical protein